MISIILLLAIGLLCLAVVSLGLAIVSLRLVVRLRRLETQLRLLERRPEPAKRTVEISRPDRMAWFLARAGWSPAEIADRLNLPLAQVEGWTRDGRADV
ncbi:hypothetical protein [Brevundimonas naejangsanensis]|uniref:hypothetical protein n=1 Tax=Brevundimonas naejangsanensis TaxID=588932 RepID=UPI0026F20645|nr:hypothetical protein [Brevundimonas naejangsanensis]